MPSLRPAFSALGLALAIAFVACGGHLDGPTASEAPPPPSPSKPDEGSSTGEGAPVDCNAVCPTLPKPAQESPLCADGTLASWTCGAIGGRLSGQCGYFGKCPSNPQQCFLASTLGSDNETIPPDGGVVGQVNPSLRACTDATDCTSVEVTDDCCGTIHVAGVNKQHAATLTACAATRRAAHGSCQCAASVYADDRTMPADPDAGADGGVDAGDDAGAVRISCRFNQCTTTFAR